MRHVMTVVVLCAFGCGGGHITKGPEDLSGSAPDLAAAADDLASFDLPPAAEDLTSFPDLAKLVCTAPTVDVDQPLHGSDYPFNGTDVVVQTFVAGRTGNLSAVTVGVCPNVSPSTLGAATISMSVTRGATVLGTASVPLSSDTTCAPRFELGCLPVTAGEALQMHLTTSLPKNVCVNSFCPQLNTTCAAGDGCALLTLRSSPVVGPPYTLNGTTPSSQGALVYTTYVQ